MIEVNSFGNLGPAGVQGPQRIGEDTRWELPQSKVPHSCDPGDQKVLREC